MSNSGRPGGDPPISPSQARRPRAPTITIDTSAGDQDENNDPRPYDSPTELRGTQSFESRESRPISPHNVSSPTAKWGDPQNFLSVPGARSRGNSVDSEGPGHSPTSYGGDTFVPSPDSSAQGDTSRNLETAQRNDEILNDEEALKPDPGTEDDFEVKDNKFAFSPGQLSKLLNPKSLGAFHALGGLSGLEKGLRSDRLGGLSMDEQFLEGTVSFEEAKIASEDARPPKGLGRRSMTRTSSRGTISKQQADSFFADRKKVFKENRLPEKKAKSIFQLAWMAYNDKVLILLTFAAVVSLALGI
ncbi:MAG: P-type calcium [Lasallia pustulata]|uniref:P-type calcium n=1 Tax=Lasallia pustulata TaxID=136370 RepID=A0A5M8PRB1_9LECA|nr:MAG: P-type calcium [Lasallia pustulata]